MGEYISRAEDSGSQSSCHSHWWGRERVGEEEVSGEGTGSPGLSAEEKEVCETFPGR